MESRLVAVPEPDILYRDEEAAVDHARRFLNALGVRCDAPETMDTPRRMADAYRDMLSSPDFDLTTFPNAEGYDELVIVRDIPVRSICEHHTSFPSPALRTSGTYPETGSSDCPSSSAWSRCSHAAPRSRNGSPCRSRTGWSPTSPRAESAS